MNLHFRQVTEIPEIYALSVAAEAESKANENFLLKAEARFGDHGIHNAANHTLHII
jgi:hypothetical protein